MAHQEILAGPLELFLAAVGEAFPDISTSPPGGNWEKLGQSGDENYTDDGVSVNLTQSIETFIPAGATLPVKAFRTEEGVEITVTVADVRPEVMTLALNDNDSTAGTSPDTVTLALLRGLEVSEYALLARGASPEVADGVGQFQVPRCYMSSDGIELVYKKGEPVGVELTFMALKPDAASESDFALVYEDSST